MTMKSTLLLLSLWLSQCWSFVVLPNRPLSLSKASFPQILTSLQASSTTSTTSSSTNDLVVDLLQSARSIGQVGSLASQENQDLLLNKAKQLVNSTCTSSIAEPAFQPLSGVFDLVYSAAPGGSSGRLVGPIYGKVQQTFLSDSDDNTFINSVQLGPLKIALLATCSSKSPTVSNVEFLETTISLIGKEVVKKEVGGGGAWKYLFMGEVEDVDGKMKLIRVMETPSLFILEQEVE